MNPLDTHFVPRTAFSAPFERALAPPARDADRGPLYRLFVYRPFVRPYRRLAEKTRARVLALSIFAVLDPFIVIGPLILLLTWLRLLPSALRYNKGGRSASAARQAEREAAKWSLIVGAVLLGGLYAVFGIFYRRDEEFVPYDGVVLVKAFLALWIASGFGFIGPRPPGRGPTSHGSARFFDDFARLMTPKGLLIGRAGASLPPDYAGRILSNPDPRHMVTVAANGAGKGVSAIVPNLLAYEGSMLAIDPKGELAAITGRRREARGQNVYTLDPWGLSGRPCSSFNPLSILTEENPDIVEDAALITDALVFDDGGSDPYWNLEARNLLQGLLLHIATDYAIPDEERNLLKLRALLTLDADAFDTLLQEMATNIGANGAVARIAASLAAMPEKQFGSIRATARVSTDFLESPRMARVLERTDFALTELKTGRTTIYLCLPAARLATHNRWLRLMIGLALEAMERERSRPAEPVVFLLDEFATLGYMRSIENAIGQIRGFGVQLWPVLQDLNQLKALYRDRWETFLGNAGTVQFFGINDQFTAQYVSRVLGEQTIYVTSRSTSTSERSSSVSVSSSERGRPLLTTDEVRRLPENQQIVLMQGQPGLIAEKLRYYADPEFEGLFDDNPLHG